MKNWIKKLLKRVVFFKTYFEYRTTGIPITLKEYIRQKMKKGKFYWPIHPNSIVTGDVEIGINSSVGATPGCYIQGIGKVRVGNYTLLAPNVGIISANHDLYDYRKHIKKEVIIGNYCWIGMNSIVLPGVTLGNHTIVAGNSVVTKSFKEGYCVIGGNPAKVIKKLEKERVKDYRDEFEFIGFKKVEKNEFK